MDNVFASLSKQLVERADDAIPFLLSLYQRFYRNRERLCVADIIDGIMLVSKYFSSTYIILDALDEFDESQRSSLLNNVNKLVDGGHSVKLFATSRPHPWYVQEFFSGSPRIPVKADVIDLKNYLTRMVDDRPLPLNLQNTIVNTLSTTADGM